MSSLDRVNFYRTGGYQVICESGFYSEETVWIPCISLQKQLISFTEAERLPLRFIPLVSGQRAVISYILFEVGATFMAVAIVLAFVSLTIGVFR